MTTIKDYLRDFALEVAQIETDGDDPDSYNDQLEEKIDEYIEIICKRIVGQD